MSNSDVKVGLGLEVIDINEEFKTRSSVEKDSFIEFLIFGQGIMYSCR
jgi:hypothetical protein